MGESYSSIRALEYFIRDVAKYQQQVMTIKSRPMVAQESMMPSGMESSHWSGADSKASGKYATFAISLPPAMSMA